MVKLSEVSHFNTIKNIAIRLGKIEKWSLLLSQLERKLHVNPPDVVG
jgi:hypothetical protein